MAGSCRRVGCTATASSPKAVRSGGARAASARSCGRVVVNPRWRWPRPAAVHSAVVCCSLGGRTMAFTKGELDSMTVAPWERAKGAMPDGRLEDAVTLIDDAAQRTRGLQIYSIEWITSLLSFVGREL